MSKKIKTLRLDDVASFMGGGTPSRNHSQYFGGGIPWVKTTDLNNGLITNTEETLTPLGLKSSSCKLVPERAVLVAMYGGFRQIGRTGLLAKQSTINQALTAVMPNTNKLLPEFLLEWFNFRVDYWKRFAASSRKDPNITKSDVADFPVPEIPITQQRDACRVLSVWTAAIDKTERLIAAKERALGALKQDLLAGNKRVKGFKSKWRKHRLSDVLDEHGELSSGKEEVFSVSVHKGLVNQIEHLGRSFAAKDVSNYNLVKPGDIVYTKSPTGDFPYGIIKQSRVERPVIVSPLYGVFTPRDHALGTFLDFYFESPVRARNYLGPIIQKGAKNTINITNATFLSNKLYLPTCNEETKAIADTLNTARQEIDLLKKQAEAYRRQKRGLMQRLLTGEWRVKNGVAL